MAQKMIECVIENISDRIYGAAHDPLRSVNSAKVVAAVDSLASSRADQDVLAVIRHADDFMRHYLADREDKVEASSGDETVNLRRPGKVQLALRLLANVGHRDLADCLDIGSPVVNAEKVLRDFTKHMLDLVRLHGGMRADGGKHRLEAVAVVLPDVTGEFTGAGLSTAHIGRNSNHAVSSPEFCQAFGKQVFQLLRG